MSRITIQLFTEAGVLDWTPFVTACSWDTRSCAITVPRRVVDALRVYAGRGLIRILISRGPRRLWAGRLSVPSLGIGREGTTLALHGLAGGAALTDIRHTALWSDTRVGEWRPVTLRDLSLRAPDMYAIDTNNRLSISLSTNQTYAGGADVGSLTYAAPSGGNRGIVAFDASYSLRLPANWNARVGLISEDFYGPTYAMLWSVAGTGSATPATGTIAVTGTAQARLLFDIYRVSGGTYTNADDNGYWYAELTDVRVRTTAAAVTADLVAAELLGQIRAVNGAELSADTSQIVNPGLDLADLIYEDATAAEILADLARRGDGAGTVYETGVDPAGRLYFRPRASHGQRWQLSLADLTLDRPRDQHTNRIIAAYSEADGNRTLRTAAISNATSIRDTGLTRDGVVEAQTTSATYASQLATIALTDRAEPVAAAQLAVERATNSAGAIVSGDAIQPGDIVLISNLPYTLAVGVDDARSFVVGEAGYDVMTGQARVAPRDPLPQLDVVMAQERR